jgi:hypothetical protein
MKNAYMLEEINRKSNWGQQIFVTDDNHNELHYLVIIVVL